MTEAAALALLRKVRFVVFDFDGVMTDNRVLVSEDGREAVFCNRSDGLGVGMLREAGVPMMILSKEKNPVVQARATKLKLECHQGCDDKLTLLKRLLDERDIPFTEVAYVGNDLNDLPCMNAVGVPVAVADAYPEVLAVARIILKRNGGHGAVRELCDLLLKSR